MVLWLDLDQKRQHLFIEVRIPEARVVVRVGRGGTQRKEEDKKS